ncbi:MAG TPA: HD domain-containing phosphohydrolase [Acidobacteriota bacterium]|nr:HD domain-containing phosphohydrolase [Acidobacteriota bacterium]
MNKPRILLVGENDGNSRRLASFLAGLDLEVERSTVLPEPSVLSGASGRVSLIVVEAAEPTEEQAERLRTIGAADPRPAVIILSAASRSRVLLFLLREGVIDQVVSPGNDVAVYSAVKCGLAMTRLAAENEACRKNLAKSRIERSRNVRRALELEEIYDTTLENLMTALDLRDVETFGHSQTVAKYSQVLAGLLGIQDEKVLDNIRKGALLHDVGKIAIPDSILKKPGRLSDQEWVKIRLHPALGYGLVKEIKLVKEAGNIILCHHEKYDGTGYPEGLRQAEIPIEARIFALADALDAITSHRPYRQERDFVAAREEVRRHEGTQFDPRVVEAFWKLPLERWERIRFETTRLLPLVIDYHKLASGK